MDIESRLMKFENSLSDFKASDSVSWQVGQIFNALLEEVKRQHGDDPIVRAIEPVQQAYMGNEAVTDAGSLAAATAQLLDVSAKTSP